jgi:hypothetical protein
MRKASLLFLLLAAVGLGACGGGSVAGSRATTTQASTQSHIGAPGSAGAGAGSAASSGGGEKAQQSGGPGGRGNSPEPRFSPHPHDDTGGGAAQFETKGADNSIEESGAEASRPEFSQAAAALHGYLDARAAGAWAAACSYMAAGVTSSLRELGAGEGRADCAGLLASLSAGVPQIALHEAAVADVGSLRVEGDRGFLLFHGAHKAALFIPMAREGGEWKVAALTPSPLG